MSRMRTQNRCMYGFCQCLQREGAYYVGRTLDGENHGAAFKGWEHSREVLVDVVCTNPAGQHH